MREREKLISAGNGDSPYLQQVFILNNNEPALSASMDMSNKLKSGAKSIKGS